MNTASAEIAPAILCLYPDLDPGQRDMIAHLDGPTMGIAGPGAGKTLVVALRGANILLLGRAQPEELVLCTYNRAAARELRERFVAMATATGYDGDVSRVRVATIHSLCGSLLRTQPESVGLRLGFGILGGNDQEEFLSRHFDEIFGADVIDLERRGWRWREPRLAVRQARKHIERICDELIDPRDLARSGDLFHVALGRCVLRYRDLLLAENLADFEHLQVWAHRLLDDDDVARRISQGIRYLICDEYQDVSHVQERLLLRLSETHGNLCVVGDEDQSLYRFRGASAGNLLRFPERSGRCHTVPLTVNYRSHPAIVGFYNGWMATAADWSGFEGTPAYRYPKIVTPHDAVRSGDYPAVIAVAGRDETDEGRQLADLLRFLKRRDVIAGYDQAALLLHSVQEPVALPYLDALENGGVPVQRVPAGSDDHHRGRRRRRAVVVTTIHQAKGREWDVVIVGSLGFNNHDVDPVGRELLPYLSRPPFEPAERIAGFDHARQHYVAFSRPRRLLVLTATGLVHPRFRDAWERLPRWDEMDRTPLVRQRFRPAADGAEPATARPDPPQAIPFLKRLDVRIGRSRSGVGQPPSPPSRVRRSRHPQGCQFQNPNSIG